jgi:hypothetical protein
MAKSRIKQSDRLPVVFSRDAVLCIEQVAAGLGVSVRSVERMDLPTIYVAARTKRFLWGQVLDLLAERAA